MHSGRGLTIKLSISFVKQFIAARQHLKRQPMYIINSQTWHISLFTHHLWIRNIDTHS